MPGGGSSGRQTSAAAALPASCAPYSTHPKGALPSSSPPTQPTTNPGAAQHPKHSTSPACRVSSSARRYACAVSRAHTAYPPSQLSGSRAARHCRGVSCANSRLHAAKQGNSAGSTLPTHSRSPCAKPCATAPGHASTPASSADAAASQTPRLSKGFISQPPPRILE